MAAASGVLMRRRFGPPSGKESWHGSGSGPSVPVTHRARLGSSIGWNQHRILRRGEAPWQVAAKGPVRRQDGAHAQSRGRARPLRSGGRFQRPADDGRFRTWGTVPVPVAAGTARGRFDQPRRGRAGRGGPRPGRRAGLPCNPEPSPSAPGTGSPAPALPAGKSAGSRAADARKPRARAACRMDSTPSPQRLAHPALPRLPPPVAPSPDVARLADRPVVINLCLLCGPAPECVQDSTGISRRSRL